MKDCRAQFPSERPSRQSSRVSRSQAARPPRRGVEPGSMVSRSAVRPRGRAAVAPCGRVDCCVYVCADKLKTFKVFQSCRKVGSRKDTPREEVGTALYPGSPPLDPPVPGDGTFVIEFGYICYRIRILCIVHVFCMYFECILMCPVHIHQDTSRYIKIHLYLSLWLS